MHLLEPACLISTGGLFSPAAPRTRRRRARRSLSTAGFSRASEGPRRDSRRGADEAGGDLPDLALGPSGRQGHHRRIRLDDVRPLHGTSPPRSSRISRPSTSTPARCASSSASSRSIRARSRPRCWRAAPGTDKTFAAGRRPVPHAGRLGLRQGEPDAEAVRDRQAGRLHAGELRQVPDGPEAARSAHRHPHARR